MSHKPDHLADLRRMSDPFPFQFHLTKDGNVVCHAIIFTSYEVWGNSKREIGLAGMKKDPRMNGLMKFIWDNYFQDNQKQFDEVLAKMSDSVTERGIELKSLRKELETLKAKVNDA